MCARQTTRESTTFAIFVDGITPTVVVDRGLASQEGTALLVGEADAATSALAVKAISRLHDPNEGQDGKGEGGPVDEAAEVRG